jgi:NAD(P)-dependent dehydrogenase (short-subunit alcohol dehydrogenase family)
MLLKNKVIIITGVGPGMGRTLGRLAAEEGAKVVLAARRKPFLDALAGEIEAKGGQVLHGEGATTDVATPEDFLTCYNVNCLGALRMAQACLPAMKAAGGGAIVNVSTMATVNPHPGEVAYAAAKGGLNALTRHMAKDFGRFNIRVNVTRMGWIGGEPVWGYVDSQVANGLNREDVLGAITKDIPLGVIPPEEDCARAVLFFVSDYSKVVTGASLDVNGGHYMAP